MYLELHWLETAALLWLGAFCCLERLHITFVRVSTPLRAHILCVCVTKYIRW